MDHRTNSPTLSVATALLAVVVSGCSSSTPAAPSAPPPAPSVITPAPAQSPPSRDPAQFNQSFWDEFVHNNFEKPFVPLQRLSTAPMIYLKTVDEAGQPMDAVTLQTVEDALRFIAPTWDGGQWGGVRSVTRGTGSMVGQAGWQTVRWPNPSAGNFCGRSLVGVDGGWIELNYLRQESNCGCNGSKMRPSTVYHELGHAFGYYHTDSTSDIMNNLPNTIRPCDMRASGREIYHAQLAYQSPVGTTTALPARIAAQMVIVD